MKKNGCFFFIGLSSSCTAIFLGGCSQMPLLDPKGPIGLSERFVIVAAIGLMLIGRSALEDLQSDPAEATLGSALFVQKDLHFIVAFSIQPRLRRHYPGAQFHPHSQYFSEYRTAHPGYTQKAGRLINLIDSGVGWNIQHITIL
jgi:hypothetical protein